MKRKTLSDFNEFKTRAEIAHNQKFNYTKYDWDNRKVYFEVDGIEYNQIIYEHVKGSLPFAYKNKVYYEKFLIKAKELHGDNYSYSDYVDSSTPFTVTDNETGESYTQRVKDILNGCKPKASIKKYTTELFNKLCKELHENKYDYKDYSSIHLPVTLVYKATGKEYSMIAYNHLRGSVPKELALCNVSQLELNVYKELQSMYPSLEVITNYRPKWLQRKELDLYIPELDLAIECNGSLYHHSSSEVPRESILNYKKDVMYHSNKTKLCLENDVKLIHLFDYQIKDLNLKSLIDKYLNSDIEIVGNSKIFVNHRNLETSNEKLTLDYLVIYQPELSFTANCKA